MNRKFGLTIGINDYPGKGNDLNGCVNDANDWRSFLEYRDFDVDRLVDSEATKAQILWHLERLVSITGYRDTLVVCFSGHGSWVPDMNGDEADGRDEVLCAYDFFTDGLISDDELYKIFSRRKFGARIFFFSDSCHSGSVARFMSSESDKKIRYMPPAQFLPNNQMVEAARVADIEAKSSSRSGAVLVSGCADPEYSYDAWFNGRANGAFTRTALDTYRAGDSIKTWHSRIRATLPSSTYPQTPQLGATWHQKYWKVFR